MPEFGVKSNQDPIFYVKRPLGSVSRTVTKPTTRAITKPTTRAIAKPTTRSTTKPPLKSSLNLPEPKIEPSVKPLKQTTPRRRSRFFTPKKYLIFVPTILAAIFLICTFYLLATRNKPAASNTPKIADISLNDLPNTTLGFYPDKIENKTADEAYTLINNAVENQAENPLSISLSEDNSSISIDVNWSIAKDFYGINLIRGGAETFELKTDIPIADFTILNTASHTNDTIILLMADGTVEYVPIGSSLQNRAFYSHGKIKDLENIIKFYRASTGTKETVLAQQVSGKLIDISGLL